MKRSRFLSILFFSVAFGASAVAEPAAESREVLNRPTDFRESSARILFFAYQNGHPLSRQTLQVLRPESRQFVASGVTNEDGFLALELAAGDYLFQWSADQSPRRMTVQAGEELEVTLIQPANPEGESTLDTKSSVPDAPQVSLAASTGVPVHIEVFDSETGRPVGAASLRVLGFDGAILVNNQGVAELRLPPGDHNFIFSSAEHRIETRKLSVPPEQSTPLRVGLRPARSELEEVVVLAPKNKGSVASLLELRRTSQAVAEVLGAEQMSRQGDSDAASSLRRVTGLTLVGGKFVYVRGLGERYSAVQMNGLSLPSPEPSRRVVPLDLFPTSVLESVVVQKSFSADLPAEFGGGLIQLKTRSLPEGFFAKGQVSVNAEDSQERLTYLGGAGDFAGVDDGTRRMPVGIRAALGSGSKLYELDRRNLETLGESLSNTYAVNRRGGAVLPSFNLAVGDKWSFGTTSAGAAVSLLSGTSTDAFERTTRKFNVGAGGALANAEEAQTEVGEIERKLGATLDLGAQFGSNHQLIFSNLFVRNTTDEASIKEFSQSGDSYDSRRQTNLEWVQRDLHVRQLHGQHRFAVGTSERPAQWTWRGGLAHAFRDSPDAREYVYVERNGVFEFNTDTTGNRRVFSELRDTSREISTQVEVPVDLGSHRTAWKLGLNRQTKDRTSDTYRLHFKNRYPSGAGPDLRLPPEDLFTPKNICPDCFELTNLTESADSYRGEQTMQSVFGIAEWSPSPAWEFTAGVRDEVSTQEVRTFFYFDPDMPTSRAGLRSRDLLPAYSATWKPNSKLRVRLAYGETVARPDFRELSTVPFIEDETGYEAVGNSRLRGTVIRNLDHRWEYYFNNDEYVSVGVFEKTFESPIEEVFEPGPNLRKTFENAKSATNRGAEFETRWGLRSVSRELRRWSILTNVSMIQSQIDIGEASAGVQTSNERPLQGQSPYMLNLLLQYDRPAQKSVATLLYNRIGARITEVGTGGRPDTYEQPFDQLDFVYAQGLAKNMALQFRARNLLDPEIYATQGNEVVRSYRRGRSLNLGFTATY